MTRDEIELLHKKWHELRRFARRAERMVVEAPNAVDIGVLIVSATTCRLAAAEAEAKYLRATLGALQ